MARSNKTDKKSGEAVARPPRLTLGLYEVQLVTLRPFVQTVRVAASTANGAVNIAQSCKEDWLSQTEPVPLTDGPNPFDYFGTQSAIRPRQGEDNEQPADSDKDPNAVAETHFVDRVGNATLVID